LEKGFAVSWSGGKDAALALYEAQSRGLPISCLLTMFAPDGFTLSHRIPREIVLEQARALGLPLVEGVATWDTYEDECFLQNRIGQSCNKNSPLLQVAFPKIARGSLRNIYP